MSTEHVILLSSTQYPGYGGSATNTYYLIKFFRELNFKVYGIFFTDEDKNIDPDNIGGIVKLPSYIMKDDKLMDDYRDKINQMIGKQPSLILSKNYIAPIYCRYLYPNVKNIYLVSGLPHPIHTYGITVNDILYNDKINIEFPLDKIAIESSDKVVLNSKLTHDLYIKLYPTYLNKIYVNPLDTTKCTTSFIDSTEITNKIWDIVIVCSNLKREIKNNTFLLSLLNIEKFDKYSKLIIGENGDIFDQVFDVNIVGLISHREVILHLKKSKVLLFPSLYDSNSNTVREAIYSGCLILTNRNIGFNERFPHESICETFDLGEWMEKAINLIENYETIKPKYNIDFSLEEDIEDFVFKELEN